MDIDRYLTGDYMARERDQIWVSHFPNFVCGVVWCRGLYGKVVVSEQSKGTVECYWHPLSGFKRYREEVLTLFKDAGARDSHHACSDPFGVLSAFWAACQARESEAFRKFCQDGGDAEIATMFNDQFGIHPVHGLDWLRRPRLIDAFLSSLPATT